MKNPSIIKSITLKQFEVLNDVLWEIQESREYEGEDLEALEELKDMFCYSNYVDFRKSMEAHK